MGFWTFKRRSWSSLSEKRIGSESMTSGANVAFGLGQAPGVFICETCPSRALDSSFSSAVWAAAASRLKQALYITLGRFDHGGQDLGKIYRVLVSSEFW